MDSPMIVARRDRALNAAATVARINDELDQARQARARTFAAWKDAGATYGEMARDAELSRATVIELVKWGKQLAEDADTNHPREQRRTRSEA